MSTERAERETINYPSKDAEKFYTQTKLHYEMTSYDRYEKWFDETTSKSEHKLKIQALYRSKKGGLRTKEYLWWFEQDNSFDQHGSEAQKFYVKGRHEKPIGQYQYDDKSNRQVCTGVSRHETVYTIEFNDKLLDDLLDKEMIDGSTKLYLEALSRTYSIDDFEDLKSLSFEDLLYMCKSGHRPEIKIELPQSKQRDKKIQTVGTVE